MAPVANPKSFCLDIKKTGQAKKRSIKGARPVRRPS